MPPFRIHYRVVEFGLAIQLSAQEAPRRDPKLVVVIAELRNAHPAVMGSFFLG